MKLNCSIVKDIYVLYEENELSEEVKGYVREHLCECEECRAIYESGNSLPDLVKEKLPEPSERLDEKMMMKLKLSRLRIALVFIIVIIGITAYNLYSQSRMYLTLDFQEYSDTINQYNFQIEDLKKHVKAQEPYNIYNYAVGEMLNKINGSYEQAVRNFNILEKHAIKGDYSNQCFDLSMSTLVLTLNNRWENGRFSEKDEEAYKRLTSEMKNIAQISNEYGIKLNNKFFIMDTKKLKDILDKLNTLAEVYTKYNKFPEEITYLSNDQLKAKISFVIGEQAKDISLTKLPDLIYSFRMLGKDGISYLGEIDAVTGEVLEIRGGVPTLKGDLIEVDKAKKKIRDLTIRNLGEGFDVNVEYLGVNVNFQSNSDAKVYCFKLQPTFKGYNIFSEYNVMLDARSNTIYNYSTLILRGNILIAGDRALKADEKYNPEEALKNLAADDINKELFKYKDTYFIKSMFTGEYVLVHYYEEMVDTKKANPKKLYINTETGKEEWIAFADGTVSY
ncbi:hypothetical protein [Candidatus Clostridium stratigraminis]|uniref:Zinc-finger domain-containing protein n=1 Tax=Candidatus Clostridium stratigraminis TaxID=3381661 RepID=A0ABW8T109_9CLOT